MFLSPVYTLMQVAPARRHYFHRVSSQDARVLRTSHHQIRDTIRWEYEIAWHRLGIYKKRSYTAYDYNKQFLFSHRRRESASVWNVERKKEIYNRPGEPRFGVLPSKASAQSRLSSLPALSSPLKWFTLTQDFGSMFWGQVRTFVHHNTFDVA